MRPPLAGTTLRDAGQCSPEFSMTLIFMGKEKKMRFSKFVTHTNSLGVTGVE